MFPELQNSTTIKFHTLNRENQRKSIQQILLKSTIYQSPNFTYTKYRNLRCSQNKFDRSISYIIYIYNTQILATKISNNLYFLSLPYRSCHFLFSSAQISQMINNFSKHNNKDSHFSNIPISIIDFVNLVVTNVLNFPCTQFLVNYQLQQYQQQLYFNSLNTTTTLARHLLITDFSQCPDIFRSNYQVYRYKLIRSQFSNQYNQILQLILPLQEFPIQNQFNLRARFYGMFQKGSLGRPILHYGLFHQFYGGIRFKIIRPQISLCVSKANWN
eukprot:TRINITY_DN645_c0_g1_i10.p1 TRINITY_DN645_c0_g1~~TRINITY_DN645_c0_g1_i10.p1  ORF type:complete len:272 (+),score=-26.01 TRINITY_DN645_c0_g1_i10:77-892(+)